MKTFKLLFTTVGISFSSASCQALTEPGTRDFAAVQKEMETDIKAHTKVIVYKREEVTSTYNWSTHQQEIKPSHYFVAQDGSVMGVEAGDYYKYQVGESYYNNAW